MKYCPIYEKEGNRFIVRIDDFVGADKEEASKLTWAACQWLSCRGHYLMQHWLAEKRQRMAEYEGQPDLAF